MTYYTRDGDNKEKISKKLKVKEFKWQNLNLVSNQLLLIPINESKGLKLKEYHTRKFDSLTKIIDYFHITFDQLDYFNYLDQMFFVTGQEIHYEKLINEDLDVNQFDI